MDRSSHHPAGSVWLAPALLLPTSALAHGGERHLRLPEVLGWWTWDPLVLPGLLLAGALYGWGVRRLWRRAGVGQGVRRWEVAAFVLSWLTLWVALLSPLDRLSDLLFSAHMSQHELLMLVAAPLLVLGKPLLCYLWALPAGWRERAGSLAARPGPRALWRWLTGPLVALVLHAVVRWVWHLPVLFEAALRSEAVHALQHLTFFSTAVLFWWALIHGRYGRVGYGLAVLFVFATAAHTSLLGALLTFARRVWYPLYGKRGEAWSLDALEDQRLAGLIMWVPAGGIFIVVGLALFAAWLGEAAHRVKHTRLAMLERAAMAAPAGNGGGLRDGERAAIPGEREGAGHEE